MLKLKTLTLTHLSCYTQNTPLLHLPIGYSNIICICAQEACDLYISFEMR